MYWRIKQQESRTSHSEQKKQEIRRKYKRKISFKKEEKNARRNLEDDYDREDSDKTQCHRHGQSRFIRHV